MNKKNVSLLFRRITNDQRLAAITNMRAPFLEKEARKRQSKAGRLKGAATYRTKGTVAALLAREANVSQYKAQQALKALKHKKLVDAISGKRTLREIVSVLP